MQTTRTARTPSSSRLALLPVRDSPAVAGPSAADRPRVRRYRLVRRRAPERR